MTWYRYWTQYTHAAMPLLIQAELSPMDALLPPQQVAGVRQRECSTCGSALGVPASEARGGDSGSASSREKEELFLEGRMRARWNLQICCRTYQPQFVSSSKKSPPEREHEG